jgi:peptidoglycan/LPS O-acetylase OafA/YrhL
MTRLRQLDSIRGIAVALVVLHHWISNTLGLGNIGVQLFFVLSGFLITGILLDLRFRREAGTSDLRQILITFWQGRAARILPVVFITLTAVLLAGDRFEKRGDMIWHFAFASNILFFRRGEFGSSLAHFWTLAVEQQFYLLWPFVILFVSRRFLEGVIVALIALAPVTRLGLYVAGYEDFSQFNVLPFANFDSLGLGALIALWTRMPEPHTQTRWRLLMVLGIAGALAVVLSRALGPIPANIEQSFYALTFAWLIAAASMDLLGPVRWILEWRPLVGLGVVSYGIYAYHVFAPRLVGAGLRAADAPPVLQGGVPLFVLSAAVTLAAACLSWFAIERPINDARRRIQARARLRPKLTPA